MTEEGTNISNLEQLSFCARTVDDDLNVNNNFLRFYEIDNIKSETVVKAIKDILVRCSLSLDGCRGKHTMGSVTCWENILLLLPKSVKGNQKQLQHIAKAIRWV